MSSESVLPEVNASLQQYLQKGYHVPGVTVITDPPSFMRPSIRIVKIDTIIPGGKTSNDHIYSVGGGKYAFGRLAIQDFAAAGRITLRIIETSANVRGRDVARYSAKVSGERFELDGAPKTIEDEKVYDLTIRAEEMILKYEEKIEKEHAKWTSDQKKEFVRRQVRKIMVEKHKFAGEMAITGAQARVVTKMLGLKPAYTLVELQKPFVIVSMTPVIDMCDPDIKRVVTMHMLGIREVLYPSPAHASFIEPVSSVKELVMPVADVPGTTAFPEPQLPALLEHQGPSVREFEDCPRVVRLNILRRLVPDDEVKTKLPAMADGELVDLYRGLGAAA